MAAPDNPAQGTSCEVFWNASQTIAVSGSGGLTDDAAFTPATSVVSVIGGFFDDVTPDSVNEGDGGAVRMSANRNLYVTLRDAAGNERGLNVDANGALAAVLSASENQVGKVGSPNDVISVTPTVSSGAAYTAADAVGGKQTLTSAARVSGGVAVLQSLTVLDLGNQKAALTLLFFDADPTAATITDNAAFVWSTDTTKFIGKINVAAADYETVAGEAVASLRGLGLELKASGSANLFVAVVTTGTPTYTSTTDLVLKYGFLQG